MSSQRSASGHDLTPPSPEAKFALAANLNEEERRVILYQGTEPPFCGGLLKNKEAGVYHCRLCGLPLFRSSAKFESGTGWPSFTQPFDPEHIREIRDVSHGMVRTEIRCARCDGHLGHVFDDGPAPARQRYCLNSLALTFTAEQTDA
jgi:peptide-methionine (R)-S-oxide reductase